MSIIELMMVLAVIAAIAALGVPIYMDAAYRARVARAIGDISSISKEIALHQVQQEALPGSLSEISRDGLLDPWGNSYVYDPVEGEGGGARTDPFGVPLNGDFDLYSMGEDEDSAPPLSAEPSQDDVVRAASGGWIGLGSEY